MIPIVFCRHYLPIAHSIEYGLRCWRVVSQNTYVHFELLPADSDDNKFVDCAVASDAEYIVTNDKHFNPLKEIPWPKVEIIKIAEFIKLI